MQCPNGLWRSSRVRDAVQILAKRHQDGLCYSNSPLCLTHSCTYIKAKVFPGGLKGLFPLCISVFAIAFLQLLLQAVLCLPFGFFECTWTAHLFCPIRKLSKLIEQPSPVLLCNNAGTQGLWAVMWEQRSCAPPECQPCSAAHQPSAPSPRGAGTKHFLR